MPWCLVLLLSLHEGVEGREVDTKVLSQKKMGIDCIGYAYILFAKNPKSAERSIDP